ncbi:hypothetical protein L1047_04565 [Synechococcus sp. Nb3U1]|uniref:hypothetical protein n=1 Tax=Synechococcus sp. Nb3U1 TaxID=1914529 RepID=UPI001F403D61|nr:hypothetical protein [Synechococcus sp. Nb3U1]MCF2970467.1 hypothetical protein [Synechococcus sp. Nb3U1]
MTRLRTDPEGNDFFQYGKSRLPSAQLLTGAGHTHPQNLPGKAQQRQRMGPQHLQPDTLEQVPSTSKPDSTA